MVGPRMMDDEHPDSPFFGRRSGIWRCYELARLPLGLRISCGGTGCMPFAPPLDVFPLDDYRFGGGECINDRLLGASQRQPPALAAGLGHDLAGALFARGRGLVAEIAEEKMTRPNFSVERMAGPARSWRFESRGRASHRSPSRWAL